MFMWCVQRITGIGRCVSIFFFFFTLKQKKTVLAKWQLQRCTCASFSVYVCMRVCVFMYMCARAGLCSQLQSISAVTNFHCFAQEPPLLYDTIHPNNTPSLVLILFYEDILFLIRLRICEGLLFSFWGQPCSAVTWKTQWWCLPGFCSSSQPLQPFRICR